MLMLRGAMVIDCIELPQSMLIGIERVSLSLAPFVLTMQRVDSGICYRLPNVYIDGYLDDAATEVRALRL
jgi:hypothetical protein